MKIFFEKFSNRKMRIRYHYFLLSCLKLGWSTAATIFVIKYLQIISTFFLPMPVAEILSFLLLIIVGYLILALLNVLRLALSQNLEELKIDLILIKGDLLSIKEYLTRRQKRSRALRNGILFIFALTLVWCAAIVLVCQINGLAHQSYSCLSIVYEPLALLLCFLALAIGIFLLRSAIFSI